MAWLAHHFEVGGWGMYPIVVCVVVLCAVTIERILFLWWPRPSGDQVVGEIVWLVRVGDVGAAISIVAAMRGAGARIARVALQHCLEPVAVMESHVAEQLARELVPIRRRLTALYAIGSIATLFGLLGAMTGLTPAFGCVANADPCSRATMLARGVHESMSCTAFGLLVALCAVAASSLLHGRADALRAELEETGQQLRNLLVEHRGVLRWNGHRAALERVTYRT